MTEDTSGTWSAALRRYSEAAAPFAVFNTRLLAGLQDRWGTVLRPVASMTQLWFVRCDDAYPFTEWVTVGYETAHRVRITLNRTVPRGSLERAGGTSTVAGDFTKPANALPVIESFLLQLAVPGGQPSLDQIRQDA